MRLLCRLNLLPSFNLYASSTAPFHRILVGWIHSTFKFIISATHSPFPPFNITQLAASRGLMQSCRWAHSPRRCLVPRACSRRESHSYSSYELERRLVTGDFFSTSFATFLCPPTFSNDFIAKTVFSTGLPSSILTAILHWSGFPPYLILFWAKYSSANYISQDGDPRWPSRDWGHRQI